jgi:hypothetical protein
MAGFNMRDYNTVADRIKEFRRKFPEGSIQQHSLEFRTFGGKDWVVYTAAAYRNAEDPRPGMGTAWEQVPGTTNFTRDSELQNAETAAWGRALVAVGAADARSGVASREEVQNRAASQANPAFQPSEAANELMGRVQAAETLEDLSTVWKSVQTGKEVGAISDHEFAVLKGQINGLKRELEAKE